MIIQKRPNGNDATSFTSKICNRYCQSHCNKVLWWAIFCETESEILVGTVKLGNKEHFGRPKIVP
jgi:hypothetical protein